MYLRHLNRSVMRHLCVRQHILSEDFMSLNTAVRAERASDPFDLKHTVIKQFIHILKIWEEAHN